MMKKPTPPASIFSALLLYGIFPIVLLLLSSFIDWDPLSLLDHSSSQKVTESVKGQNNHVNTINTKIHDGLEDENFLTSSKTYSPPRQNKEREGTGSRHKSESDEVSRKGRTEETKKNEKKANSVGKDRTSDSRKSFIDSIDENIRHLKVDFQNNSKDVYKALTYADALRERDITIHDGGSIQSESIQTYLTAIELIKERRNRMAEENISLTPDGRRIDINDEYYLPLKSRSMQGLLVGAYTNIAAQYYMANMFEKSVSAHDEALKLEPNFIPSLLYRGDTLVILGKFEDAGADYAKVMKLDEKHNIVDVFSGMVKVLKVKEDILDKGWDDVVNILDGLIPLNEQNLYKLIQRSSNSSTDQRKKQQVQNAQRILMRNLKTMHMAMFSYHDHKTKNTTLAWEHLSRAYEYKMATLPPFNVPQEELKITTVKQIFKQGFWPKGVGSSSKQPIFIVGFPRSGSTLLERVLDAHPQIAGTGEDSIFNGMLDQIRNAIVQASMEGNAGVVQKTVQLYADRVDTVTSARWEDIQRSSSDYDDLADVSQPLYFVDKMLSNYMNIGFIHMLYPNALILHVAREPMDTIFSAYKHEFPAGMLDYTCNFESLAHLYRNYRDIMTWWDHVLPGRVTHIRYEDMVEDMPRMAKAIIAAIGLEWDGDVLNFHKKKQAVNTLSTVQVRKGVYKDSLQSWRRYEEPLTPLKEMLGPSYTSHTFETSLTSS